MSWILCTFARERKRGALIKTYSTHDLPAFKTPSRRSSQGFKHVTKETMKISLLSNVMRAAVDKDAPLPPPPTPEEGEELYYFGVAQRIVPLLFRCVERYAAEEQRPSWKLLYKWNRLCQLTRQRNARFNEAAVELTQFFKQNGFQSCILKGQGNALMYEDPSLRSPGDIDIWIDGKMDEIVRFTRQHDPNAEVSWYDVKMSYFSNIKTEIHFWPCYIHNPLHYRRLKHYIKEHAHEQFQHFVPMGENGGQVCVPTDSFNRIMQMAHIQTHFFTEGIGLRQIIDYYYLLRRGFTPEERDADVATFRRLGMTRFAAGIMFILHKFLGLREDFLLLPPDKAIGRLILNEVLTGGNFGIMYKKKHGGTALGRFFEGTGRILKFARIFPSETLSRPLIRIYHYLWKLTKNR